MNKLRTLKLQINTAGAWRNVVEFEDAQLPNVKLATIQLAREVGNRATWRITRDSRTAEAYLGAPRFTWSKR